MKSIERQYAKQFLKSNYRLLILVVIIQILIIQNLFFPINLFMRFFIGNNSNGLENHMDGLFQCICFMAFLTPIYQYRYLMKRSSSDLYLSLPIKREDFFRTQFLVGVGIFMGTSLLALCISSILSFSLFSMLENFIRIIALEILGITLYALFTWIVVKCNTLLDSILICVGYTITPVLLLLSAYLFSNRVIGEILLSSNYGMNDAFPSDILFYIISFLSTPVAMLSLVNPLTLPFSNDLSTLLILFLYWVVFGMVLYQLGKKAYTLRKGEESGGRTRAWMCYPTIIGLFTICLLMILGVSKNHLLNLLFVCIAYLMLHFFANRKFRITLPIIVQFCCFIILLFSLEQFLISNKYFDNVQEQFNVSEIKNERIFIRETSITENEYEIKENLTQSYESKDWDMLNDEQRQAIQKFHNDVLMYCSAKEDGIYTYDEETLLIAVEFYISINSDLSMQKIRSYTIKSEEGLAFIYKTINEFIDLGILKKPVQGTTQ